MKKQTPYNRLLETDIEIEHFVDTILNIDNSKDKRFAINKISSAEKNISNYYSHSTLKEESYRDFEFRNENIRQNLYKKILNDLKNKNRLSDDDKIILNRGGAKPRDVKQEKKAFYIIGSPASGKSTISNIIADKYGAYILDSDYAKRKFPEYKKEGGATLLHEESDAIVFSNKTESLFSYCISNSYNIVMPKIGSRIEGICSMAKILGGKTSDGLPSDKKYTLYLILVELDRLKATQRAYNRFIKTNRYIPLSVVFDSYSNEPLINYYKIKQLHHDLFNGYAQISTDVDFGQPYKLIEQENLNDFNEIIWE